MLKKHLLKNKRIVVIGGANGTAAVLQALKRRVGHLSVIQTPADDGGSGGAVRAHFKIMAPGDARRALVALSETKDKKALAAFTHRFETGPLKGQVLGNLIIAGLARNLGGFEEAIEELKKALKVRGDILPASLTPATLYAVLANGHRIVGETHIDLRKNTRVGIMRVGFVKPVPLNPRARQAIERADAIIIGPGDLYTSIIPNFLVTGMKEAVAQSEAKKIYIINAANKPAETAGFTDEDYVRELKKYVGVVEEVIRPRDILGYSPFSKGSLPAGRQVPVGGGILEMERYTPSQIWRAVREIL
ncbi:MAG: hypothetical protein COU11_03525 [Candidatus Harrisonbacteria bacterium CG10_big_fil_rev_8_21_14_0_10_49_15]|uniref:Gluconeogenesis factor n=1 Tax=Candidatus Harrisonbacteria bacterium CG10_big_fil_rev_8_21_14_0_10_49_15 TaxID=1974587 RepID=A0A2H0UKG6_9BACT|nr:MAG: hypothetical protein COU11_03525 [Candidatus Harrisonbacteria bacterium CG10_big_fil_rev_8_21_14_0_10_49_15]